MKKWFFFLLFFGICSAAHAVNWTEGYDKGPLNASDVSVDCRNFSLNLSCADHTVQEALNTLDQLVASSGSGTVNSGLDNAFTYYPSSGTTVDDQTVLYLAGSNIGIGSTTPGKTLDVQGTGRFSSTLTASNFSGTSSGTNTGDQTNISGNAATVTTNANLTGPITSVGNATTVASQTGTGSVFVMNTSPVLVTPNIGTATGSVTGNAGTATALAANGTNCSAGNYALGVDASGNSENCTAVTSSQWVTQNTTDVSLAGGNVGIGTTATTTAALSVMNGNVGIGTWKPAATFEISGTGFRYNGVTFTGVVGTGSIVTNASPTITTPNIAILAGGGNANSKLTLKSTTASGTTDSIVFLTASSAQRAVFDTNGNFGLGTTLPTNLFEVGTKTFVVTASGGNVGIGSATPGVALDVTGTIRLNGTGAGSFRIQSASNQACTTTCTTGKALAGLDQGTLGVVLPSLVGPSDATADQCLCGS